MLRKIMIALTAVFVLGALSDNADARARHWGGGHRHFGHHHHHGHWHGGGWGWGWPAAAVGFGIGAGYYGYPYYAGGCYRSVRLATPRGWRWRRVWVCG